MHSQSLSKQTTTYNKQQPISCSQCLTLQDLTKLIYMAQFATHICKKCYHQQSTALMLYKQNKPTLYPSLNQIITKLYLGNQDAACDKQTIASNNISAVCVCGDYLLMPFTEHLSYKQFFISDSLQQQIVDLFEQSYQWIASMLESNKTVLVHCAAGVSRSASFVIAYLMRAKNITYLQAYQLVKSKRTIIKPNSNFVKQLKRYEQILSSTNESNKINQQVLK